MARPFFWESVSSYLRCPPSVIQRAVWLYFCFSLIFRDVEEMLSERVIDACCETVRRWVLNFGPAITNSVRSLRNKASGIWMKFLSA